MKFVTMKGTDLTVSSLCLGAAYLGSRESWDTSCQILNAFTEAGGCYINTAHEYGHGKSEETLGRWMKERGNRHELILATKGGEETTRLPDGSLPPRHRTLRREELLQDMDESLARLGTDYVDLYMLHVDEEEVPVEEIIDTLDELHRAGKARFVGCSNWSAERIKAAFAYSERTGKVRFAVDEIEWNMAQKSIPGYWDHVTWMDREYLDFHRSSGFNVSAYSPFGSGTLTRYLAGQEARLLEYQRSYYLTDETRRRCEALRALSERTGIGVVELQLGYLLTQQACFTTVPIVGSRTVEQLRQNLRAADMEFDPKWYEEILGY